MLDSTKGGGGPVIPSTETSTLALMLTYSDQKPDTIPLNRCYVHVANEKIYFGRGGELKKGGLIREKIAAFGPQRDPLERLKWAQEKADDYKSWLFEPGHVVEDENGEFDCTDCGGRCLIQHIRGAETIEAFVSKNISLVQRAVRFREHAGSRVALGAVQEFLADVAKCDKRCVAIKNALHPNFAVKKSGLDRIDAIGALKDIHDHAGNGTETGVEILRRAAQLCGTAYRPKFTRVKGGKKLVPHSGHRVEGVFLVAVALVVESLPSKYNEESLRKYLADHTPDQIKEETHADLASAAQKVSKGSLTQAVKMLSQHMAVPMARHIGVGYNKSVSAKIAAHMRGSNEAQKVDCAKFDTSRLAEKYSKNRSGRD